MSGVVKPRNASAVIHQICRFTVGGIWVYQGLFPKLLGPHPDEIAMAHAFGITAAIQADVSRLVGVGEVLLGVALIALHKHAWPHWLSSVLMAILLAFVVLFTPAYLTAAFNPVVMNLAAIALSAVAILNLRQNGK